MEINLNITKEGIKDIAFYAAMAYLAGGMAYAIGGDLYNYIKSKYQSIKSAREIKKEIKSLKENNGNENGNGLEKKLDE